MQIAQNDNTIVCRLERGEDVIKSLETLIEQTGIRSAVVTCGIGMLVEGEIGYFDGKAYLTRPIDGPHELVSMQGTITTRGEIVIHLHVSLAGRDHALIGGHLKRGVVGVVGEVAILKVDDLPMSRKLDPGTGLGLLSLE